MRVFVTGATGFVGAAVVRELLRRDHEVTGLVRNPAKARALADAGMVVAVGDMWQPQTYRQPAVTADAVIHAAQEKAPGRWNRRAIARMHESDLLMTRTLANRCAEHGLPFVYTSGGLKYTGNGDAWISEDAPMRPCLLAKGHADAVAELNEMHQRRGLRLLVITPGFVYGPGSIFGDMIEQVRAGRYRVIGDGANYWSLVHIDDLAVLYALALERGRAGGHWFAADEQPLRRREIVDRVAHALGLPRPGRIPGWLVGLWMGFALVEAITVSMRLRNDRAKHELGWVLRYPTFADGLPSVLQALGLQGAVPG